MPRDSSLPVRITQRLSSIPGVRFAMSSQEGDTLVVTIHAAARAHPRLDELEPRIAAYCAKVDRPVSFVRKAG
jgi:hypothetical protein